MGTTGLFCVLTLLIVNSNGQFHGGSSYIPPPPLNYQAPSFSDNPHQSPSHPVHHVPGYSPVPQSTQKYENHGSSYQQSQHYGLGFSSNQPSYSYNHGVSQANSYSPSGSVSHSHTFSHNPSYTGQSISYNNNPPHPQQYPINHAPNPQSTYFDPYGRPTVPTQSYVGQSGTYGNTASHVGQSGTYGNTGPHVGQSGIYGNTGPHVGQSGNYGNAASHVGQSGTYGNTASHVGQSGNYGNTASHVGQSGTYGNTASHVGQSGNYGNTASHVGQSGNYGNTASNVGQSGIYGNTASHVGQLGTYGNTASHVGQSGNFGNTASHVGQSAGYSNHQASHSHGTSNNNVPYAHNTPSASYSHSQTHSAGYSSGSSSNTYIPQSHQGASSSVPTESKPVFDQYGRKTGYQKFPKPIHAELTYDPNPSKSSRQRSVKKPSSDPYGINTGGQKRRRKQKINRSQRPNNRQKNGPRKSNAKHSSHVPVIIKKKKKTKKTHSITVLHGFYVPGGTQTYGKFKDIYSCQKACDISPTCFAGDFNPWLGKCYLHSNFTACASMKSHKQITHFKKIPCSIIESSRGLVTLGAMAHSALEQKGVKHLTDCIKKCATAGGGIAANTAAISTTPQLCFGIDFDFSTHKCFFHVDSGLCNAAATIITPVRLVASQTTVNILICPNAV